MTGYTETLRKYAADTTHSGLLENADGTGEVGLEADEIGRRLAVRFTLNVNHNRIETIRFQVFGCGFTIAACAAAAELSEDRSLEDIQDFTPATIDKALDGLPEERGYCATLAYEALQAAVISVSNDARPVQTSLPPTSTEEDHAPRLSPDDPVYQTLMASKEPAGLAAADRQLFACLLAVATQDPYPLHEALGLSDKLINAILAEYFPALERDFLELHRVLATEPILKISAEVLRILRSHVPTDVTGRKNQTAERLARIIAARAAQPGHLWTAMGLFERSELTAVIRRHLPTLAAANKQGMRWKRYLFKQACDLNGGRMCKSPNCGECSDYALCFAPD